jgi:hypothetical protein
MIRKVPDQMHIDSPASDCSSAGNGDALTPACGEQPATSTGAAPISRPAVIQPLSPARYKIEFTIDEDTHDRLRRVQDLLRHAHPDGDLAAIFARALRLLESQLTRTKLAASDSPRQPHEPDSSSRHVPWDLRRVVWQRDGGRCAYKGDSGRCTATAFLEYHHVVPFAAGGEMSIDNIELRCRAHNQYEARIYFGRAGPPSTSDNAGARSGTS